MNKRQRKKKAKKFMDKLFSILNDAYLKDNNIFTQTEKMNNFYNKNIPNLKDFNIEIDEEKGSLTASYKIPIIVYQSTHKFSFKDDNK